MPFDFLLAVLGGGYLLGRGAASSIADAAADARRSKNQLEFTKQFYKYCLSEIDENDVKDMLRNEERGKANPEEIRPYIEALERDFEKIYQKRPGICVPGYPSQFYSDFTPRCIDYWVLSLVLAEQGRVVRSRFSYGYQVIPQEKDDQIRTLQVIEEKLQKHHPELEIVFVPDTIGQHCVLWDNLYRGCFKVNASLLPGQPCKKYW